MKRIAVIHPEGNVSNNPNLAGTIEILCEKGFVVDIYTIKRRFYQVKPCAGSQLIFFEELPFTRSSFIQYVSRISNRRGMHWIKQLLNNALINRYMYKEIDADLVIGVDRDGIIEASRIAKVKGIPYGLISYEIFFEDETGQAFKKVERDACKDICFAVCQDSIRANELARENNISRDKIITIPVAGRGLKRGEKTYFLHHGLGIDSKKHIALFMGSVCEWTMANKLLKAAENWPDDWVLVIHPRYGSDDHIEVLMKQYEKSKKVYFSLNPVPRCGDLFNLIKSADIGISLYKPLFRDMYTGNNIKYVGLASGKFTTFMQHGIPVIMNEIGVLTKQVKQYKLGLVVNDELFIKFPTEFRRYRERCYSYFEQVLDLDKTIQPLLETIFQLV